MKKLLLVIMVFVMAFALLACGGESATSDGESDAVTEVEVETEVKAEAGPVKSTNAAIVLTVEDGYLAEIGDYYERITIKPEESEEKNSDYIEIEAPGEKGIHDNFQFYVYQDSPYQYNQEEAYSADMLRADIDAYIAAYPNIYSNPRDVTLGDYDYIVCDCTTNGEASHYYFTIVQDKPCTIGVVGGDILDINSDAVKKMIESITFEV